jgi:FkbM family methyltransferase
MSALVRRAINKWRRTSVVDTAQLHVTQEVSYLRRLFNLLAIDMVFDVGANAGQYATMLREKVRYGGPIVSVEPMPDFVVELQRLTRRDPNWHIEQLVLGERIGSYAFNVMADRECSSLLQPSTSDTQTCEDETRVQQVLEVEGETLDAFFDRWARRQPFQRAFLKLDTQGADMRILLSGQNALTQLVAFQSELALKRLYDGAPLLEDALRSYRQFGYDVSALHANNTGFFPDLIEINCVMIRRDVMTRAVNQMRDRDRSQ